jgi:hypothetical protein
MRARPTSLALLATLNLTSLPAIAQIDLTRAKAPTCFFMECEEGKPNPGAAQPSSVELASMPAPAAQPPVQSQAPAGTKQLPRPRAAGESCARLSSEGAEICASSVLKSQLGFTYGPTNLLDGKLDTGWVEGAAGNGEGEWVLAQFGGMRSVTGLEFLNGYHKNEELFRRNNRVAVLEIQLSNGVSGTVMLDDASGVQKINLGGPHPVTWVKMTIRAVYPGTRYRDTALSEMRVIFAK